MEETETHRLENYLNSDFPQTLYHYTNLDGFKGIIETSQIWFSNLYFLNDRSEYNLGFELIIKSLENYKAGFSILKSTAYFIKALENALIFLKDKQPPYILSLTANHDLLSQWRGYTQNGVGVNLGLDTKSLKKDGIKIFKCIYDPEIQNKIVNEIVTDSIFRFIGYANEQGIFKNSDEVDDLTIFDEAGTFAGNYFMDRTSLFCSLIKDISFSEEDEWRALIYNNEEPEFLCKSNYLKPVKTYNIKNINSTVNELWIGPNPEKELCRLSMEMLFNKHKIDKNKIQASNIPYRN
jgi:hypothetical protein